MLAKEITDRFKEERKKKKISQAALARSIGLDSSALSLIEAGKRDPSLTQVEKIAKALNVPVEYLLTGKKEVPAQQYLVTITPVT